MRNIELDRRLDSASIFHLAQVKGALAWLSRTEPKIHETDHFLFRLTQVAYGNFSTGITHDYAAKGDAAAGFGIQFRDMNFVNNTKRYSVAAFTTPGNNVSWLIENDVNYPEGGMNGVVFQFSRFPGVHDILRTFQTGAPKSIDFSRFDFNVPREIAQGKNEIHSTTFFSHESRYIHRGPHRIY